eukprot:COSAG01_NODE_4251_length_5207_cov_2.521339_5_plen_96_part_00
MWTHRGRQIAAGERRELDHHDTLLFGAAHLYAFVFPQKAAQKKHPGGAHELTPSYEDAQVRVRVERMGSQQCRIAGQSQPVLMMIIPMIFTRTRR